MKETPSTAERRNFAAYLRTEANKPENARRAWRLRRAARDVERRRVEQ